MNPRHILPVLALLCGVCLNPTAHSHAQAIDILRAGRGTDFDPDIIDAFLALQDDFQAIAQRFAGAEIDEEREAERMRQVFGQ